MFIEFKDSDGDDILINTKFIMEISLIPLLRTDLNDKIVISEYMIKLSVNGNHEDYTWCFEKNEKELAEKEFNKIKERLLGC